ncbi:MAG: RCC1 domain-containing protein [Myxococcota bacterium]
MRVVVILALAACGGSSSSAPPPVSDPEPSEPQPVAQDEPVEPAPVAATPEEPEEVAEPANQNVVEIEALTGARAIAATASGICGVMNNRVLCVRADGGDPSAMALSNEESLVETEASAMGLCARGESGAVFCQSAYNDPPTQAQIRGLRDATQISVGNHHGCALRGNGRVVCWDSREPQRRPRRVSIRGASAVAAAGEAECAIVDSAVTCWALGETVRGCSDCGRSASPPAPVEGTDGVRALVAAGSEGHAIVENGTVVRFSLDDESRAEAVAEVAGAQQIGSWCGDWSGSGCAPTTCVIDGDGYVTCWARSPYGRVGRIANAAELTVGRSLVCARREDATVACIRI